MSVSIASSLVRAPTQKIAFDSATTRGVPREGTDFASLLLGQLAANTNLRQDPPLVTGQDRHPQTDNDQPSNEVSPQDASMLLAAMGFTQTGLGRSIDFIKDSTDPVSQELTGSLNAANSLPGASLDLNPKSFTTANSDRFALPDTVAESGKPAIIAGNDFILSSTETPLAPALIVKAQTPVAITPLNDPVVAKKSAVSSTAIKAPITQQASAAPSRTLPADAAAPAVVPSRALPADAAAPPVVLSRALPADAAAPVVAPSRALPADAAAPVVAPSRALPADVAAPPVVLSRALPANAAAPVVAPSRALPADSVTTKNAVTEFSAAPTNKTPTTDSEVIKAVLTETSPAKTMVNDLAPGDFSVANMQSSAPLAANIASTSTHHSQFKVDTPLRDPAWASDFGQKLVWMASNDKQVAQITINPPDMGPIEISLTFNKDSASALFVSPHAEVRETIEAALPRLKEMLADVGIQLGQSNVGSESFRQQAGNQQARQDSPRWRADNAILGADLPGTSPRQADIAQRGNGRVDTFA